MQHRTAPQIVPPLRVAVLLLALGFILLFSFASVPALALQEAGEDEPAGAQARAEQLVHEQPRAGKKAIQPARVVRLEMRMARILDRRTGVAGFRRQVEEESRSLDDRLRDLDAEDTGTEVIVRLPGAILFDFDSAALRPDAERTLADLLAVLRGFAGRPARIEGHTDSVASEEYNQRLSEQRAESVRQWLVEHGIERDRLQVLGYGETVPVADNGTAAGRQRNRRVEVVIEKG